MNVNSKYEITQLFVNFALTIGKIVQNGNLTTIKIFCDDLKINSSTVDDYTRVAKFFAKVSQNLPNGCFPSYRSLVGQLQNTGVYPDVGRFWITFI